MLSHPSEVIIDFLWIASSREIHHTQYNIDLDSSAIKMRVYGRLLATATDAGAAKPFRPAPMALLPPIPLYRRLLRAHRKLPREERTLGDLYVKAEFHAHKDIDNPVHIVRRSAYYLCDAQAEWRYRLDSSLSGSSMLRH